MTLLKCNSNRPFKHGTLGFANNTINNGSACSILFTTTTGLFPSSRKILQHNKSGVLKYSAEDAEPLFIVFRQFSGPAYK